MRGIVSVLLGGVLLLMAACAPAPPEKPPAPAEVAKPAEKPPAAAPVAKPEVKPQLQRVIIRFAADFPGPPHPAALAITELAKRLPEVIPGSQVRFYPAGSLYTIPEAFEAQREGNLEMTWGQFGKTAAVDKWMNAIVMPGVLTTVGAVEALEQLETFQMLVDRFESVHGIKVFGSAHMSFGMGPGGKTRLMKPEDFRGKKIRTMAPADNVMVERWGGSPVVMAFGEVPSALEAGVIDGLTTSIGGWISIKEQVPYYTIAGVGTVVGDYYWVGASRKWWDRLNEPTQQALEKLIKETIQLQKEFNWCVDKMTYEKYGTKDPTKPGVYWATPEEARPLVDAVGDAVIKWVKTQVPAEGRAAVDKFVADGRKLSGANPPGTSWVEKVDCAKHAAKIIIR